MDVTSASRVVALRPALETLIAKTTEDPESLLANDPLDIGLVNVVESLSHPDASRHAVVVAEGEVTRYETFSPFNSFFQNIFI